MFIVENLKYPTDKKADSSKIEEEIQYISVNTHSNLTSIKNKKSNIIFNH